MTAVKKTTQSDSLSMYLFLFSIFFLCRRTSPINHFLFIMADFRIHVVDKVGIVRFAKDKGICHFHQFTISCFGGDACRFQCSLHDAGTFYGALDGQCLNIGVCRIQLGYETL